MARFSAVGTRRAKAGSSLSMRCPKRAVMLRSKIASSTSGSMMRPLPGSSGPVTVTSIP